jgi:cytochrome c2
MAIALGSVICVRDSRFTMNKPLAINTLAVVDILSRKRGEKLFNENCVACHKIGKGWIIEGPSLTTVGQRLPDSVIKQLLFYPEKTIASNDYLRSIFNQFNVSHPTF